ncbi:conserved hypothetical protein [Thiomonas arsenitoxydans]|uniref:Uncharacterized protein n=1 Tax=Thiomonas arsenitoxydans (strain DSM 22701 / CIP 110005 / 3As) TaxID=426114 RepID=D6CVU1_THIA3|nr:hypothetical protein [Thiomonas arsenitoxydans]CAZ90430.1 hypothetical protein; putative exported protein [Thiomonas arsenitoxydans]CQR32678.1 conserved hypothetical protein [Thiomonas arsenitoxydans]CQR45711.1 conserved protein of unknown function [Thiomonas sp. CB3]
MFHTLKYRAGFLHLSYPAHAAPIYKAQHDFSLREFKSLRAAKIWLSIKSRQPGPLRAR